MKHVSVTEALEQQQTGVTYVDVRSTREFAMGHPAGAVNVPLADQDAFGQMVPNPDFVEVIQAHYAPETPLLIGCQAGGRSMRAVEILEASGYTELTNVVGGYGGGSDPSTGAPVPGWSQAGLPVERDSDPAHTYAGMREKLAKD